MPLCLSAPVRKKINIVSAIDAGKVVFFCFSLEFLEYSTLTNLNMQNSIVIFIFFCF